MPAEHSPPTPPSDAPPSPPVEQPHGPHATAPYRFAEQHTPPPPVPMSPVARTTFEHVYEVDPRLMQVHVLQQVFPNWDTLRIMRSRHDHLDWMHRHFAEKVVTGSEILAELDAPEEDPAWRTPPDPR